MPGLDWLTARPVAHRGLHDAAAGIVETRYFKAVAFMATADRMMTLGELCDLVAGRVTLVLEVKSHFDGDTRLAARVAEVLQGYAGPVAAMSFDPFMVRAIRAAAPGLPRGLVAQAGLGKVSKTADRARYAGAVLRARPHFLAWSVRDLPGFWPLLGRWGLGLPLLTWTVRTEAERLRARRWADQMIFEGFRPQN
jgi:glycerophosphoryl diester phosphodiesterase